MKRLVTLVALLAALTLAPSLTPAALTPINPLGGGNGSEPSLVAPDGILDTLYGLGNLQRLDDSIDQLWINLGASAKAEAKFASFTQDFGIVNGASGGSFQSLFVVSANGFLNGSPSATFNSQNPFRFADKPSGAQLWTSSDADNGGQDHMVAWKILSEVDGNNNNNNNENNDENNDENNGCRRFVLAWEDKPLGVADKDYNDLVVEVTCVNPVPEPATMLLLGGGLLGVGGLRRKLTFWKK